MALNKIARALSVTPAEAKQILPKEVVAWANELRRTVEASKKKSK